MRHVSEGQLRAYHDGALPAGLRQRVQAHLTSCERCAELARQVQARGTRVQKLLEGTAPDRAPLATETAWYRYRARQEGKEAAMRRNVFSRRYGPAWVAAGLIVAFALSFSFAPVRALANDLLQLFRVQRIEFIEVDPSQLSSQDALEAAAQKLEGILQDQMTLDVEGPPRTVDAATARAEAGFAVRLPAALDAQPKITLEPGLKAEMTIDLPRIRLLLTEMGYGDVDLPDTLHGATVGIQFETMVSATYGECGSSHDGTWEQACIEFAQVPAPRVSAPPELDLGRLGQVYLQLLGLSEEEASQFSERVDWTTTLVVPLPRFADLSYTNIDVDGVEGTLLRPSPHSRYAEEYLLTWIKGNIVYALHGSGSTEAALSVATSLE
jgi:hypothetical protein